MIWVVDDFADGEAERAKALGSKFEDLEYDGFRYPGMSKTEDVENTDKIAALISTPIINASVLYRYYAVGMKQEGFIHSDASVARYTGILFLSHPKTEKDGLALWKHKETGMDHYTGSADWERLRDEGFDESKWWMTEFVPMRMGRLAVFPAARWHSRYPQPVDNSGPDDGRLIKVFFCR